MATPVDSMKTTAVTASDAAAGHADHQSARGSTVPSFSTAYSAALTRSAVNTPQPLGSSAPIGRSHIPLNASAGALGHHLHEQALALRAYRLQLLASNIANADTPGYKALDIDVEEALRSRTAPQDVTVKYHVPMQASLDGNTVEMDVERAKFVDAAVRYQFSLDRAINHYMHIADLFKSLKD